MGAIDAILRLIVGILELVEQILRDCAFPLRLPETEPATSVNRSMNEWIAVNGFQDRLQIKVK